MTKYEIGPYFCTICESYYGLSNEFCKELNDGCAENGSFSAVVKCQCGLKWEIGGRTAMLNNVQGIVMFNQSYDADEHWPKLIEYDAVMLSECDPRDPEKVASVFHLDDRNGPKSLGRSISLKPGKATYIFRNPDKYLPGNMKTLDDYGILWGVSGEFQGRCGVLEWCTSYCDAYSILQQMKSKTDNPESIRITNIGRQIERLNENDEIHCTLPSRHGACSLEDIALIEYEGGYATAHVVGVKEDRNGDRLYSLWVDDVYGVDGDIWSLLDFVDGWITSTVIADVIRCTHVPRPLNYFQSFIREHPRLTGGAYEELSKINYYVPNRGFRQHPIDMFHEQYPMRQDGSFNKKLFKRWLRQNLMKVLAKKSEVDEINPAHRPLVIPPKPVVKDYWWVRKTIAEEVFPVAIPKDGPLPQSIIDKYRKLLDDY